jgi:thiamine transport system permease protein
MDHHRAAVTRVGRVAIVAVPVAFLAVFFAWPVIAILERGLAPDGALNLDPLGSVLTDPALRHVFWFTVWQALVSTVPPVLLAVRSCSVATSSASGRGALVTVPFVLPTVVVGAFGPSGSPARSTILLAHVFFNYAVVVRTVGGLWSHLDPRPEEAAQVLGANRWRTFVNVTLPALRPAIIAAASIVFLFCFTSFGVILVLGGPRYATLETEIYRQTPSCRPPGGRRACAGAARRGARRARGRRMGPGPAHRSARPARRE